jgi:hypothetical protein
MRCALQAAVPLPAHMLRPSPPRFHGKRPAARHRSMVGRRALGQIDELLKQAKGNDREWFGGINVILVGTHEQRTPACEPDLIDPALWVSR